VQKPRDFRDPAILSQGAIRIAALDGREPDPATASSLEPGLLARRFWARWLTGWLAALVRTHSSGDEQHIAPGADTIRERLGGSPRSSCWTYVCLPPKVERAFPDASSSSPPLFTIYAKLSHPTPQGALVYTLAVARIQGRRRL